MFSFKERVGLDELKSISQEFLEKWSPEIQICDKNWIYDGKFSMKGKLASIIISIEKTVKIRYNR